MNDILPWWLMLLIGFGLATVLWLSLYSKKFNKRDGTIYISHGEDKDNYLFEFNILPEAIPQMKQVVFKVVIKDDLSQNLQSS